MSLSLLSRWLAGLPVHSVNAVPTTRGASMITAPIGGASPIFDNRNRVHTGERCVDQYGPEWLTHVLAGGEVRQGNILVPARPAKKAAAARVRRST